MEYCCYRTNLDFSNIIEKGWNYKPNSSYEIKYDAVPITKSFKQYLESFNIKFDSTLLFYADPAKLNLTTFSYKAHVDMYATGELANPGLNYVIGGNGSLMHWYKYPNHNRVTEVTSAGTFYQAYPVIDLELIDSFELTQELALVRTDVPHSITLGNKPRLCISIRMQPKKHIAWNQFVQLFEEQRLLLPR